MHSWKSRISSHLIWRPLCCSQFLGEVWFYMDGPSDLFLILISFVTKTLNRFIDTIRRKIYESYVCHNIELKFLFLASSGKL